MFLKRFLHSIEKLLAGKPGVADTYWLELNRQCLGISIFTGFAGLLAFLPYIPLDQQLHPESPAIPYLRAGFSLVGLLVLLIRKLPLRYSGILLIAVFGAYLQISTAIITALSGPDPAYVGGYLFVLMIIPLGPAPRSVTISIWLSSLVAFGVTLMVSGGSFQGLQLEYSRNDLATTAVVSFIFIIIADLMRRNSWQRAIEMEKMAFAQEKLRHEALDASTNSQSLAELARKANNATNFSQILGAVHEVARKRFGSDSLFLAVLDRPQNRLLTRAVFLDDREIEIEQIPQELRSFALNKTSGVVNRTWQRQRSLFMPVVSDSWLAREASPTDLAIARFWNPKWFLFLLLISDGNLMGLIGISGKNRVRLRKNQIEFSEKMAAQVAGAARAIELWNQAVEARIETEALSEMAKLANQSSDPNQLLNVIVNLLKSRHSIDRLLIYVIDKDKFLNLRGVFHKAEARSIAEIPGTLRRIPLEESTGSLYQTFLRRKTTFFSRIPQALLNRYPIDDLIRATGEFDSFIQVPLIIENEVCGIICFGAPASHRILRNAVPFCERIAAHVAGAIRSMELLHQARQAQDESDRLLHSILPSPVATELKNNGFVEPLYYDSVTVLFTDFVGFTKSSAGIMPHELIQELDGCFSHFDEAARRNGLEKLKTIGDSYMCAGGLPQINYSHAIDACLTALEFREFIKSTIELRKSLGKDFWEIRIGIHSGPVIAGVIGTNKFTYDIWGDTVNTASRMESAAMPGQINISRQTYDLVKEFYLCQPRGNILVKESDIEMYTLERIRPELSADTAGMLPSDTFLANREKLTPTL